MRVVADGDQAPRRGGPAPRPGQTVTQYGLIEIALSRCPLAGVVRGPLSRFADRLGMQVERSVAQGSGCEVLYLETDEDAFALVTADTDPAANVEVWAYVAPGSEQSDRLGQSEFRRFLALAEVPVEDVVFGLEALDDPEDDAEPDDGAEDALFAGYREEDWPTREQLADLPRSLTGLGLEQPISVLRAATDLMTRAELQEMRRRFCHGWPGDDEHVCECAAMDIEGPAESVYWRRVDAHVTAESLGEERLFAVWVLAQYGPSARLEGVPVEEYLTRFAAYDGGAVAT